MHIEHFSLRLRRPAGVLLAELEQALLAHGAQPLRWAITAVEAIKALSDTAPAIISLRMEYPRIGHWADKCPT